MTENRLQLWHAIYIVKLIIIYYNNIIIVLPIHTTSEVLFITYTHDIRYNILYYNI